MSLLIYLFSCWQWELSFHFFFLQKFFCASNCCHLFLWSSISAMGFAVRCSERVSGQGWPLQFNIINPSCSTGDICIAPGSKGFHWAANKSCAVYFTEEPQLSQKYSWGTYASSLPANYNLFIHLRLARFKAQIDVIIETCWGWRKPLLMVRAQHGLPVVQYCCGLTPASSSAPCSRSLTPPCGLGERTGRVKVRKLVCWDKDSLIGKAKDAHASEAE